MKKIISLVILTIFFFSCQKDGNIVNNNNSNQVNSIIAGEATPGRPIICESWRIGSLILDGKDLTSDFEAYTLNFCSDNLASAVSEKMTFTGKWASVPGKTGPVQLLVSFDSELPAWNIVPDVQIDLLNASWEIIEVNDKMMKLRTTFKNMIQKELILKRVL